MAYEDRVNGIDPLSAWVTAIPPDRWASSAARERPGEYRVNHRGAHPEMDYRTEDLDEALARGRLMGMLRRTTEPPLGPIGTGGSRKSKIYRHNRKVAARRLKRNATGVQS